MKVLEIKSTDNSDVVIVIAKIQYVLEKKDGCIIAMDNGNSIKSGANFKDVMKAIK